MQYEKEFLTYYETRDEALRNELVEKYLYMVENITRRYQGKGIDRDDIYQVGAMALIMAVERFDPTKGFEFTTFATPTILGEIKKHFRDKGWSMKVPRRLKETAIAIPGVKDALTAELGRVPTTKEMAERMDLPEEDLLAAMESSLAYAAASLNQAFDEDDGEKSVYEKYTSTKEAGYEAIENQDLIESVLATLSDVSRFIFRKRFVEEKTQEEVARSLGVSQMTVSRAEKRLRERFAEEFHGHA